MHLEACWQCRGRSHDIENAISGFIRSHRQEFESRLPDPAGPRALLKAQLAQLSASQPRKRMRWWFGLLHRHALSALAAGLLMVGVLMVEIILRQPASASVVVSSPNSRLTPGAAILSDRKVVCALENVKNKAVSVQLQREVFKRYAMQGARAQAYEVDYLVTPALGGANDVRNLWPHSYSAAWNAKVKDRLEDLLRDKVCDGSLELGQAQREIAGDWIAAYKKYFRTDKPLPTQ